MAVKSAISDATILFADDENELQKLVSAGTDLLLVNRQLDYGFASESGVELIRQLREKNPNLRAMLISNYPEAQAEALAAGALPGFGKREIGSPRVREIIRQAAHADPETA
jgi:CheY-like chemotaxis protein